MCSSLSAVLKDGSHHLIMQLPAPLSNSKNDCIFLEQFTLHYYTRDNIAQLIIQYGRGSLIGKLVSSRHLYGLGTLGGLVTLGC